MAAIMFNMYGDTQGNNAYAPAFTDVNMSTMLSQDTLQNFTIPSDFSKWIAVFSYSTGANVFIASNVDAEVPGSSFSQTASQLSPATRLVRSGDVLSFITPDTTAIVSVSLYGYEL